MPSIKGLIKKYRFARKWRKLNNLNETVPSQPFPIECVNVGIGTYGVLTVLAFNNSSKLIIGHYCSIGPDVVFLLNSEHNLDTLSTYPYKVKLSGYSSESFSKGNIIVKDDVWIGYGSTILSGITIGRGAVIAAGSVVTKDVPDYAIVGGNPARIIKYRFSQAIISELSKIDFSKINRDFIVSNLELFYETINDNNYYEIIKRFIDGTENLK